MSTLIDILDSNKASFGLPLLPRADESYSEYHATITFADKKITVQIYNDEGWTYELGENDGMPFEWAEQITKFVNELKQAEMIPEYTLDLLAQNT